MPELHDLSSAHDFPSPTSPLPLGSRQDESGSDAAGGLRLRPLLPQDRDQALAAHEALAEEDFAFVLGWEPGGDWEDLLHTHRQQSRGLDLADNLVPATFLAAVIGTTLVGRVSVRHELNDYLASVGGHIGYAVVPAHRRRGHATQMLRQALVVARSHGVDRVLITCDDANTGSLTVIERCGGVLENRVTHPDSGITVRRYWVD